MTTGQEIRLEYYPEQPGAAQVNEFDGVIVVLPAGGADADWSSLAHSDTLAARYARAKAQDPSMTQLVTDMPNAAGTRIAIAYIAASSSAFELLTLARKLVAALLVTHPASMALCLPVWDDALAKRVAEALLAALLAGCYALPTFKSKPQHPRQLSSISIFGLADKPDFRRTFAESAGNNLARHLTALPPNELDPTRYRERIAELANEHGWEMKVWNIDTLKQEKAGAFLAVVQGSTVADAAIAHLHYQPKTSSARRAVALVGKGICFDTGGTNLKPSKNMYGMHEDMEGSAVALGTLLALSQLEVDFPVDCWLALAQNHIGPLAYKQNDVVTASNGVTIEIVHTDAEGRMVLADTLVLAAREKPALMLDYATLTGTCVAALGTLYSGAFTNRTELISIIIEAGRASGERVWPFPMDADYDKGLDSEIADIKQCSLDSEADHILASRFLSRFVDASVPWIHIDLSSGNNKGGLAHIPTDITGFGVRFTLNLLLDQQLKMLSETG